MAARAARTRKSKPAPEPTPAPLAARSPKNGDPPAAEECFSRSEVRVLAAEMEQYAAVKAEIEGLEQDKRTHSDNVKRLLEKHPGVERFRLGRFGVNYYTSTRVQMSAFKEELLKAGVSPSIIEAAAAKATVAISPTLRISIRASNGG